MFVKGQQLASDLLMLKVTAICYQCYQSYRLNHIIS